MRGDYLIAAMRDRASMNQGGLNRIQFIFPKTSNVVCLSHTLENVGNHFVISSLTEFVNLWICLFSHHQARIMWEELTVSQKVTPKLAVVPDGRCTNSLWKNLVIHNDL